MLRKKFALIVLVLSLCITGSAQTIITPSISTLRDTHFSLIPFTDLLNDILLCEALGSKSTSKIQSLYAASACIEGTSSATLFGQLLRKDGIGSYQRLFRALSALLGYFYAATAMSKVDLMKHADLLSNFYKDKQASLDIKKHIREGKAKRYSNIWKRFLFRVISALVAESRPDNGQGALLALILSLTLEHLFISRREEQPRLESEVLAAAKKWEETLLRNGNKDEQETLEEPGNFQVLIGNPEEEETILE